MRRPLVIYDSEFPYIWGKFVFLFISVPAAEREERLREEESSSILLLLSMSQVRAKTISMWASLHLFIVHGDFLEPEPSTWICQLHFVGKINSAGCLYRGVNLPKVRAYTLLKICRKVAKDFLQQFYIFILCRYTWYTVEDCGDPAAGLYNLFCLTAE